MKRRTFTGGLASALLLARRPPAASAPKREPPPNEHATLTVDAGKWDRKNTPVVVQLPPDLEGLAIELRDEQRRPVPVTTSATGQAIFVLRDLPKGKQQKLALREVKPRAARGAIEVKREPDGVLFSLGGARVLRFQTNGKLPAGIDPKFLRGGYIHPVFTPSGQVVTDDYPDDHKHHHGIWAAWTKTEYLGRHPDFWNMGDRTGKVDFASLGEVWTGPVAAGFSARNAATDLGGTPPRHVLDQDWKVTVYRTHDKAPPYFVFDAEWTDTVAGEAPLELPEYRYGGIGIRGARAWKDKAKVAFLTSEGKDRVGGDSTAGRWFHMGGPLDSKVDGKEGGKPAGMAVLGHPSNFRAPQPLRINPADPFVCWAPSKVGAFKLQPGVSFVSRYRFVVADGAPDKELLDRLWNDYADPPAVSITM